MIIYQIRPFNAELLKKFIKKQNNYLREKKVISLQYYGILVVALRDGCCVIIFGGLFGRTFPKNKKK